MPRARISATSDAGLRDSGVQAPQQRIELIDWRPLVLRLKDVGTIAANPAAHEPHVVSDELVDPIYIGQTLHISVEINMMMKLMRMMTMMMMMVMMMMTTLMLMTMMTTTLTMTMAMTMMMLLIVFGGANM